MCSFFARERYTRFGWLHDWREGVPGPLHARGRTRRPADDGVAWRGVAGPPAQSTRHPPGSTPLPPPGWGSPWAAGALGIGLHSGRLVSFKATRGGAWQGRAGQAAMAPLILIPSRTSLAWPLEAPRGSPRAGTCRHRSQARPTSITGWANLEQHALQGLDRRGWTGPGRNQCQIPA